MLTFCRPARTRTVDNPGVNRALYQLSYGPRINWSLRPDLNWGPPGYKSGTLPTELHRHKFMTKGEPGGIRTHVDNAVSAG